MSGLSWSAGAGSGAGSGGSSIMACTRPPASGVTQHDSGCGSEQRSLHGQVISPRPGGGVVGAFEVPHVAGVDVGDLVEVTAGAAAHDEPDRGEQVRATG